MFRRPKTPLIFEKHLRYIWATFFFYTNFWTKNNGNNSEKGSIKKKEEIEKNKIKKIKTIITTLINLCDAS